MASTAAPCGAPCPNSNVVFAGLVVSWPCASLKFGPVIVDFVPTIPSASVYSGVYLSASVGTVALPGADS